MEEKTSPIPHRWRQRTILKPIYMEIRWRLGSNQFIPPPEIEYILNNACIDILFVGAEFYDVVEQLMPNIVNIRQLIAIDGGHSEWPDYGSWRDTQDSTDPMLPASLDDDVMQLYTSGTTGHPKGVQLTNGNYLDLLDQAANGGWGMNRPRGR